MSKPNRYRWLVVAIFAAFMLLHQSDKLLIGPLTPYIIEDFHITKTQMGAALTGALVVGTLLYPLWGYLYDRYARSKLLALASFIWGSTTWLSAIAPTYPTFLVTRASTGIDDSSYPGLYSLIADYFGPTMRSKIYGLLQLTQPLGYLMGMILALMLAPTKGWRFAFYLTGTLGIVLAIFIFFGVREMPRGQAEPELRDLEIGQYRFSWEQARKVFRKRTMWFIILQGFFGVIPWNVITYWFFAYLQEERHYTENEVLLTMVPAVLVLASGYFVGGYLGDWLFKKTLKGRIIVSIVGVLGGAVLLYLTMQTPIEAKGLFLGLLVLAALFMPFSSPNVVSTVQDVSAPEVRSTAMAVEYFIENSGAALAPLMAGMIADASNLHTAIISLSISAWLICFAIYLGALFFVDNDIQTLRALMAERAALERSRQAGTA